MITEERMEHMSRKLMALYLMWLREGRPVR